MPSTPDNTLESSQTTQQHLKTAIAAITEAEGLGTETLSSLQHQGEILARSQNKAHTIEAHTTQAKYLLRDMSGIVGKIKNAIMKKPKNKDTVSTPSQYTNKKMGTPHIHKTSINTNEDALLSQISVNVNHLGELGRKMGDELTHQNSILDTLTTTIDSADKSLKKNRSKICDLMP